MIDLIDFNIKTFKVEDCCVFRKTKNEYGGLSNMAGGFPLLINGVKIRSSEALYQSCRFPHRPDIQEKIINQTSPMFAKFISKHHKSESRVDWDNVQVDVMYWCLRIKLAQNLKTFLPLLLSTTTRTIVEHSRKNDYWGAKSDKNDNTILCGANVLGQLLMILRNNCQTMKSEELLIVTPPGIPEFLLYGEPIQKVDVRSV